MGPVSKAAAVEFQREITGALGAIVKELRLMRGLLNQRLGENALDHETFGQRFETLERRVTEFERRRPA